MLIKSSAVSFEYINLYSLTNHKIGIPIFQRFYDWKEKQMFETINDILNAVEDNSKEVYLLDFIWYEEDGMMKIADGQQRLVSINLLFKAINDYISEESLNLEHLKLFDISYDNLTYDKKYKNSFNNYVMAPFKKMYLYLKDFVFHNKDKIEDIISILKNNLHIYIKKTANADDAFTIFTQINTGGKPLSKDEVMQTTITQYSEIYGIEVNSKIKELRKAIVGYYKYLDSSSGKDFDTIAVISFIKENIVKDRTSFRKFVNYLEIVSKISDYSISHIVTYLNRSQLFDILNVMALKGINFQVQKDYINLVMFPLCLLSIVMTMKKANPGGIIKVLYSSVIDDIKNDLQPILISSHIASFINQNSEICKIPYEDFVEALGKKELSTRVKEAILIMDVVRHSTSSDLNVSCINLEHVYPQKPALEWSINGWPTEREEQSVLIHNIGNYLLLNEEVNKRIKNKYITYKVDEYRRIEQNDLALQTEINKIDYQKFEQEKASYIYNRQRNIAEYIYKNFILAPVIIIK